MAKDNFFDRLTRLMRSGPALQRKIKGQDYKASYDRALSNSNLGFRGHAGFGKESSPFSALGAYGILDRMARYSTFSTMEQTAEISTCLDIYADEICASDDKGRCLSVYSENPEIKGALEELFIDTINVDFNLRPWSRNMSKYGDFFLFVEVVPDVGVISCTPIPVNELERDEGFDPQDPAAVRFKWLNRGNKILENWQVIHMRILGNDMMLPYGTCHEASTKILTKTGIKEIKDIVVGDFVANFDKTEQKKVYSKVLGVKNSGNKQCCELRTKHNFLQTTEEHWISVYKDGEFTDKQVKNINVGDFLVIDRNHNLSTNVKINKTFDKTNKNGWQNSKKYVPECVDEEFAQLFGFLLGDGWRIKNAISFACGVNQEQNDFYAKILEKYSGKNIRTSQDKTQMIIGSKMLSSVFLNMGFVGKASTKRIPSWVYGLSEKHKKAFIKGFVDADGSCSNIDKWKCKRYQIEIANYDLCKDLKTLIQSIGYKSGQIGTRTRKSGQIGTRKFKKILPSYYFYFFETNLVQPKKNDVKNRISNDFIVEPVISKHEIGKRETYDIWVEHSDHNFYANGIVTHNSVLDGARRVHSQLTLMEDAMLTYRVVRSPERRVFYIDIGNTAPNDVPSFMEATKAALRSNTLVDRQNGRTDQRYNPISIEEDYFIPIRGEAGGTKIETLAGGQHVSATEDVEYLQKKLFAALKVPRAYFGYDEGVGSKATLASEDVKFSRTISIMQKIIIAEFNKLAILHLYAKGFDGEDLVNFELFLTNPSSIAVQQKLALWNDRMDIAAKAKEAGLVGEEWIQEEILGFTPEDISKTKHARKEDVLFAKELEAIAVSDESQERHATVDPFDPSNYQVPGAEVEKNPASGGQPGVTDSELVKGIAKFDQDGQIMKSETAPGVSPVKATPYATRMRRNDKRQVGQGGIGNLGMPNFKRMLDYSGKHQYNTDIYDTDFANRKNEHFEMERSLKKSVEVPRSIRKMLDEMDRSIGRNKTKILVETFEKQEREQETSDKLSLLLEQAFPENTSLLNEINIPGKDLLEGEEDLETSEIIKDLEKDD